MRLIIFAFALLVLFVSGCVQQSNNDYKMSNLVSVNLSFEGTPSLGNEVNLVVKYHSGTSYDNVYFHIGVPDAFEVTSGETEWTGRLDGDRVARISIIPKETGTYQLASLACIDRTETEVGASCNGGGVDDIFVKVNENDAEVSGEPFDGFADSNIQVPGVWQSI